MNYLGWNIRWLDLFLLQSIERKIANPWMTKNLFNSIKAQSVWGFPLNHSVNEISPLHWPVSGNLLPLDLNLLGQNLVSDLLSASAIVRPFYKHKFVCNYPNSKVVSLKWVILPTQHLRSHVPRCSASVTRVILSPFSSHSKICDSGIPFFV